MPHENDNSIIGKYDEIMTSIGNHLFEAECLLNMFMKEMAEIFRDRITDIEMELPGNGIVVPVTLKKISWNDEKRYVELKAEKEGREYGIDWENLAINVKNLIADYIHIRLLSDEIYGEINNR